MDKQFTSLEEYVAYCSKSTRGHRNGSKLINYEGYTFTGGATYEQACKLAVNGWQEGLEQINEGIMLLTKPTLGRMVEKHIAGSHPDVARFIAGMPNCMNRRVASDAIRKPCLDIMIDCSYTANVDASSVMNYGIAITSLVDTLESMGYSLSILAATACDYRGERRVHTVAIKKHGEAFDIGRIAFVVAHPAYHRRLSFAYREVMLGIEGGDERSKDIPADVKAGVDLFFDKPQNDFSKNLQTAFAHVKNEVRQQLPDLFTIMQEAA